jgi:hypothetical protein
MLDTSKYQYYTPWIAYALAAFVLLGYSFEIGRATQHQIDREQIKSADKADDSISGNDHRKSGGTRENQQPRNQHAETGRNEATEISLLGVRLGEGLLVIATFLLVGVTSQLVIGNREATAKQLRAYIICGGFYGVPKDLKRALEPHYRPAATDYHGPWRLAIRNIGQTPGTIISIEWGICPVEIFPRNKFVSDIIKNNLLETQKVDIQEIMFPSNPEGIETRHVQCGTRVVDTVTFGRINYVNIFRKKCHSTFAYRHRKDHSDSIGPSFSDDWS